MLVAVISDTHGISTKGEILNKIRKLISKADVLIHLGDYVNDVKELSKGFIGEVYAVMGNGDFLGEYPKEQIIELLDKRFFICHGHNYGVNYSLNSLYYKAKEEKIDAVLFGHTHVPFNKEYQNISFFNPGSAALPRAMSKKSIGFIELENGKPLNFYFKEL